MLERDLSKKEKDDFLADWLLVDDLHVRGWNLNELEHDFVETGLAKVELFLAKILALPKDKKFAENIYREIFDFDEAHIAQKIHQHVQARNAQEA